MARARRQSERLARLARDLLDLSRLDAEVDLRREPVDVGELCRAVASEFAAPASERPLALQLEPTAKRCDALADPVGVARIVRTLLENAAPPAGVVTVSVSRRGEHVIVALSGSGPGVRPEERERIFERFERGSAGQGAAGFGLGLAIGRELARRMSGDLRVDDARGGARFELTLPASTALAPAAVTKAA